MRERKERNEKKKEGWRKERVLHVKKKERGEEGFLPLAHIFWIK